ncbi:adenylate/guanylate cyclase domain-containing protein [Roseobacteraceae bacterium NS-SX3]
MTAAEPDKALLKRAEVEAERVVGILRIGVALGLIATFFLVVGPNRGTAEPYILRQWVFALGTMVAYLLMGVLTLWMARSGRFRSWMVWPGVTLDCAFMLANVWIGLENTGVPGDLAFVLPPVWLVPVVMALAVLRFNPWLQAYCAVLIAGGMWALVLWQPEAITPHAVERAAALVSAPPNAIRVTMILLGGVVLVAAAYRARALLHRSIAEAQARANLTRYLPAQLAGRLAGGGLAELRQGERQMMAVLFTDIRGFTSWSEGRDPQEVSAFITEFRTRVQRAADAAGGLIDKYIGDAAMVLFQGASAPERALDCAARLQGELAEWSALRAAAGEPPVRAGTGVHWGEVFSGVVGNAERLEYSVFGDTVNVAARLEELTKSEGLLVIVSAELLKAAGTGPEQGGWTALPAVHLRGRSSGIGIFGRE